MKNPKLEIINKLVEINKLLNECEDIYMESELDSNFFANRVDMLKFEIFDEIENLDKQ